MLHVIPQFSTSLTSLLSLASHHTSLHLHLLLKEDNTKFLMITAAELLQLVTVQFSTSACETVNFSPGSLPPPHLQRTQATWRRHRAGGSRIRAAVAAAWWRRTGSCTEDTPAPAATRGRGAARSTSLAARDSSDMTTAARDGYCLWRR